MHPPTPQTWLDPYCKPDVFIFRGLRFHVESNCISMQKQELGTLGALPFVLHICLILPSRFRRKCSSQTNVFHVAPEALGLSQKVGPPQTVGCSCISLCTPPQRIPSTKEQRKAHWFSPRRRCLRDCGMCPQSTTGEFGRVVAGRENEQNDSSTGPNGIESLVDNDSCLGSLKSFEEWMQVKQKVSNSGSRLRPLEEVGRMADFTGCGSDTAVPAGL